MATLADRIVVLDRGEKIADGPAEEVLTDRRALGVYFGTTA
jgi:ABC-type branched-subunit amino acid transport system ATPase component